jgi:ubiquinol-cytochrome c reductase cytochrome c1 subunit
MMKRYILTLILGLFSAQLLAEESVEGLQLAKAPINVHDMASIKRGAKFFNDTCMSCHTLNYLRYDRVAKEAGIDTNKQPMVINGTTPPDLSLETDARGVDWVYTYLYSFYKDPASSTGVNNLIFPGTAMPAVLAPFQGEQVLVEHPTRDLLGHVEWYDLLKPASKGSMTPEEFNATVTDLINFLAYASQPFRAEQERIGYWVLGFLVILFVLTLLLKKEYWKDVEKQIERNKE